MINFFSNQNTCSPPRLGMLVEWLSLITEGNPEVGGVSATVDDVTTASDEVEEDEHWRKKW